MFPQLLRQHPRTPTGVQGEKHENHHLPLQPHLPLRPKLHLRLKLHLPRLQQPRQRLNLTPII